MANASFPDSPLKFGMFDWIEHSESPLADVFEHKMQLAEAADQAGFHGWFVAEHQGTPLSLDVSPSVLLASAVQRTKQLHVGSMVFCLPWYNPYRFYNEICMLDQLSRGRIELGLGRGISPLESSVYGVQGIDESRGRYRETLDVFMQACQSEVLNFKGEYYSYEDIGLFNRPYQKPYPPLWFPSANPGAIDFSAKHGYSIVVQGSDETALGQLAQYRETWVEHQNDPDRHNGHVAAPSLARSHHIVVADTDKEAEELGQASFKAWADHLMYLWEKHGITPPIGDPRVDGAGHRLITGTPSTVTQQIVDMVKASTINYVMLVFSFGDMAPERVMHSLDLFNKQVAPAVRAAL